MATAPERDKKNRGPGIRSPRDKPPMVAPGAWILELRQHTPQITQRPTGGSSSHCSTYLIVTPEVRTAGGGSQAGPQRGEQRDAEQPSCSVFELRGCSVPWRKWRTARRRATSCPASSCERTPDHDNVRRTTRRRADSSSASSFEPERTTSSIAAAHPLNAASYLAASCPSRRSLHST